MSANNAAVFATLKEISDRWPRSGHPASGHKVTMRQLLALMHLAIVNRPIMHRELHKAIGTPKPATTRLIDELRKDGLVTKRRSTQDGRDVFLEITDKGRAVLGLVPAQERNA